MDSLIKSVAVQVIKLVYSQILYPMAKNYVESTDNEFDDAALKFLDSFVSEILKKLA